MVRKFWHITLLSLLLFGCKSEDEPELSANTPKPTNISILGLREIVGDKKLSINQDLRIGGYVTTSDRSENFYKTFFIEDGTAGVEIMAGLYDLSKIYPMGYYITVDLNGCAVGKHYEALQVGREAEEYSDYPTDYFSSRILLDQHITRYDIRQEVAPMPLQIGELMADYCGRLVSIGDLTLSSDQHAGDWEVNREGRWRGYNFFSDDVGREVVVYTSEYANFADKEIPLGKLQISGILQRGKVGGKEYYMIKLRDEEDCTPYR